MNGSDRAIGLHLRFTSSYSEIIKQAADFNLPIFQFFLSPHGSTRLIDPKPSEQKLFAQFFSAPGKKGYVHVSYLVNLASPVKEKRDYALRRFLREIEIAQTLSIYSFVLHPGSFKGSLDSSPEFRAASIKQLAFLLDGVIEKTGVHVVLENSAYGGCSIGGTISELSSVHLLMRASASSSFCIDIAHAHAFGYEVTSPHFVAQLEEEISFNHLSLLHLHDSATPRASKQDKHLPLGKGVIPCVALEKIVSHERLEKLPIILELPLISCAEIEEQILLVKKWANFSR